MLFNMPMHRQRSHLLQQVDERIGFQNPNLEEDV
jgi:hypothetical protein